MRAWSRAVSPLLSVRARLAPTKQVLFYDGKTFTKAQLEGGGSRPTFLAPPPDIKRRNFQEKMVNIKTCLGKFQNSQILFAGGIAQLNNISPPPKKKQLNTLV